jgi:hypothetical protein
MLNNLKVAEANKEKAEKEAKEKEAKEKAAKEKAAKEKDTKDKEESTKTNDKGNSSSEDKTTVITAPKPNNNTTDTPKSNPKDDNRSDDDKKDSDNIVSADSLIDDNVVYYCQTDPSWSEIMYSSTDNVEQTIGSSGCGTTSMAMAISSLTETTVTPIIMSSFSVDNDYRTKNKGTSWGFFAAAAKAVSSGIKALTNR